MLISAQAFGINASGQIVGFYQTAGWGGSRGFCESEAHANVRPKASREKNIRSDRTLFR